MGNLTGILPPQAQKQDNHQDFMKPTLPEQTSCLDKDEAVCPECGNKTHLITTFGYSFAAICESCEDKKREIDKAREAKKLEQERLNRISKKLQALRIGDRFKGMTFDHFKPVNAKAEMALAYCKSYVDGFNRAAAGSIIMLGSPGTGKNMMAAIICQELIKLDFTALHTTAIKLVRRIKTSWNNNEESEQDAIDAFVAPDLLIVDEVGVQFGSATEQLFLTEVINERYERRKPTILITNLILSELQKVMGERVIDRFYDDESKILVFDWSSYRRKDRDHLQIAKPSKERVF